jgi:hypothetical protein
MANPEHLAKLKEGVKAWNDWCIQNRDLYDDHTFNQANFGAADLRGLDLRKAFLINANFNQARLSGAKLSEAHLERANLMGADLTEADLRGAILFGAEFGHAKLIRADLRMADLSEVDFYAADLSQADLRGTDLTNARLVATNLEEANLAGCRVYGVSVWDVRLNKANQSNLVITPRWIESAIQVDNLAVAQFIYLLLNNENIRHVVDTITSKVVLILGRFTDERKPVLDAIRDELRKRGYLPVLFDFQKPDSKDLTGTVMTLANMARFIIADLTDSSSLPHELASIVPTTSVALQTIILKGQHEYAMFTDLKKRYRWVLSPYRYDTQETLLANLDAKVISPAEAKAKALSPKRRHTT